MNTLQHKPLDITPEQRQNLITLAKGLLTIDVPGVEFNMSQFTNRSNVDEATDCGTAGCAVGWAPFFGIEKSPMEEWYSFCRRSFGVSMTTQNGIFLFGTEWYGVDNSKNGAAKRIIYALMYGVPYNIECIADEEDLLPLYQHLTLADLEAWEATQKGGGK